MKDTTGWLAACIISLAAAGSGGNVMAQEVTSSAEDEYAAGHYTSALALFEARAAAGDSAAAEIAGQMLYYGGTVYGPAIMSDRQRARRYLEQAASGERPAARYLSERADVPASGVIEEEYVPGPAGC